MTDIIALNTIEDLDSDTLTKMQDILTEAGSAPSDRQDIKDACKDAFIKQLWAAVAIRDKKIESLETVIVEMRDHRNNLKRLRAKIQYLEIVVDAQKSLIAKYKEKKTPRTEVLRKPLNPNNDE